MNSQDRTEQQDEIKKRVSVRRRAKRHKKLVKRLIIVLAVTVFLGTVLYFADIVTPEKISYWYQKNIAGTAGDGYPAKKPSSAIISLNATEEGAVLVSDVDCYIYNERGSVIRQTAHSCTDPVATTSPDSVLIYDSNGKTLRIETRAETLVQTTYEQKIVTADISPSGVYGVVTSSKSYACEVSIYNKTGEKRLFYWCPISDIVMSISVNEDGDGFAATAVSASGGDIITTVYYFSLDKETPIYKQSYTETVLADCYTGDFGTVFVGDKNVILLDVSGKEVYNKKITPKAIAVSDEGVVAVYNENNITIIETDGQTTGIVNEVEGLRDIVYCDDDLYGLYKSSVIEYNQDGTVYRSEQTDGGIRVAANEDEIYILTASSIEQVK